MVNTAFILQELQIYIKKKSYRCPYLQFAVKYCQKMRKSGNFKFTDFSKNSPILEFDWKTVQSFINIAIYFC